MPGRAGACNWPIHATELDFKFELTELGTSLGTSCLPYSNIRVHQAAVTLQPGAVCIIVVKHCLAHELLLKESNLL